jgi:hypothetical protein
MKKKGLIIGIVVLLIVSIISGFLIHNQFKNAGVDEETATEISYDFFKIMFPLFNSKDIDKVAELYLPCQGEENYGVCFNQMYHDIFSNSPLTLDGVFEIEETKGNSIKGQVIYSDLDGSYNVLDELDNGWSGFGNKKVANFELVKKEGKMYLKSFEIVANYNWRTIQQDPEFFDKYMTKLYKEQTENTPMY